MTLGTAGAAQEELTECQGSHEEEKILLKNFTAKSHHITEKTHPASFYLAPLYWKMYNIYQQATNELNMFLLN